MTARVGKGAVLYYGTYWRNIVFFYHFVFLYLFLFLLLYIPIFQISDHNNEYTLSMCMPFGDKQPKLVHLLHLRCSSYEDLYFLYFQIFQVWKCKHMYIFRDAQVWKLWRTMNINMAVMGTTIYWCQYELFKTTFFILKQ